LDWVQKTNQEQDLAAQSTICAPAQAKACGYRYPLYLKGTQ
jgi:hypothetical protein